MSEEEVVGGKKKPRVQTELPIPNERVSFSKHLLVLENAVVRTSWGKSPVDSKVLDQGLPAQTALLTVAFQTQIGLLERKNWLYSPVQQTMDFVRLKAIDEPQAKSALREIIDKTWFAEVARTHLMLRRTMDEESLIKELAIRAKPTNYEQKKPGLRVLIEYLEYVGIVRRENGAVTLGEFTQEPARAAAVSPTPSPNAPPVPAAAASVSAAPVNPSVASMSRPLPAGQEGWVHKSWPGLYTLSFQPTPKALKALERAVADLRAMIEDQEQPEG